MKNRVICRILNIIYFKEMILTLVKKFKCNTI